AACEAAAQRAGWTPGLFRTYYLAGGVLTVAYLGGGSAWLLLPRRGRDVLLGALLAATAAAAVTVALAPVSQGGLAATAHGRPPGRTTSSTRASCSGSRSCSAASPSSARSRRRGLSRLLERFRFLGCPGPDGPDVAELVRGLRKRRDLDHVAGVRSLDELAAA